MKRISEITLKFKWFIVLITILFTVFTGYQLTRLKIDADIVRSLPDNDPDAALLKQIGEDFGGNSMGIIILETDNVYKTSVLEHVRTITDSISNIKDISSVTSLTNIINIRNTESGFEIGKLVDEYELPETQEALDQLKSNVLANEMYKGSIVSEDGTSTVIIFTLSEDADVGAVASQVIEKTEKLNLPEKLYYIGSPMLINYISGLMRSDLTRLLPLAFLLIAFILFLSFKNPEGVVMPLLTATIAIIWSMGLMSLFGFKMSMISNNIPIILLAVGSAYPIHVLNRINQLRVTDRDMAIRKGLEFVIVPVLLAAVTTMVGFISFIFGSYLDMILEFGIFTALGTAFACLLAIFFVPAMLDISTSKKRDKTVISKRVRTSFLSKNFLSPLKLLLFKHPKYVLTAWTALIIISFLGLFFINRSVDIQDYFKEGNPTREAERIMVEKFGGTKPVFVLFEGDMKKPDVLQTMYKTGEYMEQSPDIYTTQSIADLVAQLNNAVSGNSGIPDEADKIEQLWFFLEGNEAIQRFVNEDLTSGIIISKFKSPDIKAKQAFADYMNKFIAENARPECKISITGMPFIDITMDTSLVKSQLGSIFISVLFVIIIVTLIMKSFSRGIFAAIPVISSVIILFGVMGLSGIPLNIATVLVASLAVGIGVDYSIHIISHFSHIFKITGDAKIALEDTIEISGKAIIINVISVSAGFLILIFSEMVPLQYFGILVAVSMIGSSLAAITLLPVVLILIYRNKNSKHLNSEI